MTHGTPAAKSGNPAIFPILPRRPERRLPPSCRPRARDFQHRSFRTACCAPLRETCPPVSAIALQPGVACRIAKSWLPDHPVRLPQSSQIGSISPPVAARDDQSVIKRRSAHGPFLARECGAKREISKTTPATTRPNHGESAATARQRRTPRVHKFVFAARRLQGHHPIGAPPLPPRDVATADGCLLPIFCGNHASCLTFAASRTEFSRSNPGRPDWNRCQRAASSIHLPPDHH